MNRYPIRRFHLPEVILRCLRTIIIKKNNNTKSWTDDGWLKNPFPRWEFLAYVFPALHQACKVGATMIPISQMRKLRYREVKSLIRKGDLCFHVMPPCLHTLCPDNRHAALLSSLCAPDLPWWAPSCPVGLRFHVLSGWAWLDDALLNQPGHQTLPRS